MEVLTVETLWRKKKDGKTMKEAREKLKANPMKLVSRMKKIQDLLTLKEQCHELLAAKQDLIDKARITLVGNRRLLQRMQAYVAIPLTSDSDVPAFANFNQIVDEWAVQVRSRTGDDERHESVLRILTNYSSRL